MNDPVALPRRRPPVGLLDAATLLALVMAAAWLVAPVARARSDAAREEVLREDLVAVAEALARRKASGAGYLPLPRLIAEDDSLRERLVHWPKSTASGVAEADDAWLAILFPDSEGRLLPPDGAAPPDDVRGFLVLVWPRDPTGGHLRGLAAASDGGVWQHEGPPPEPGSAMPVPDVVFSAGASPPERPGDWTITKRWRRADGGER